MTFDNKYLDGMIIFIECLFKMTLELLTQDHRLAYKKVMSVNNSRFTLHPTNGVGVGYICVPAHGSQQKDLSFSLGKLCPQTWTMT